MKSITFSIIFFLLIGISCDNYDISSRQTVTFLKYYGSSILDIGNDVKQLPNGGYFVAGTISINENNTDVFALITDEYGDSKTDLKIIGGPYNDKISMLQLLPDGGAVAIGTYQISQSNSDIWILRFNNFGDTLWTRKFGSLNSDEGSSLTINDNNEIVCTGYSTIVVGTNILDKQIWISKIDLEGNVLWEKIPGFTDQSQRFPINDIGNSIISSDDNNIILWTTNGYPPGTTTKNILLLKINKYGSTITLTQNLVSNKDEDGKMVKQLSDGNFLVLGTSTDPTSGNSDIVLYKLDTSFNVLWSVILDDNENETASSFIYKDNQIFILGTTNDPKTDTKKLLFITTDSQGENPVFYKYGFLKEKLEGFGMDKTSDGGFIFTGSSLFLYKIKDLNDL